MATAISPESGTFDAIGTTGGRKALTLRQECELLRAQVELERQSFVSHWRDLCDYILPRRARFFVSDTNKGDRRNQKIIDSTGTMASRTLSSGMMSGVTSPARPWFLLSTPDPDTNKLPAVKAWLHDVGTLMMDAFRKSNLYNALPTVYGDMGTFATGAMFMQEDDEHVFRFTNFAVGEYGILLDEKGRVRTLVRTFRLTVQQVVQKWGAIDHTGRPNFMRGQPTSISRTTQGLWARGTMGAWVDLVHVIRPNQAYDAYKIDAKYKAFEEIYYEITGPNQTSNLANDEGVLAHAGYDEFPALVPRWEVTAGDLYGTNCPGMVALGDIKQLQTGERRSMQAVEKSINPPMVGPSSMRTAKPSILPGDITYADMQNQHNAFRPAHEINYDIRPLEDKQQQTRLRIQRAYYEDLFLMLAQSDRREITAREIDERHEEKLLALGPMLEQLNQDLLDPLIERAFNIMVRKGLIPDAPPELHGVPLRVEYVSILAQAQKQVGLAGLERFAGFAGQVAQFEPSALDRVDADELMVQAADGMGVPPKIIRSDEDVAALRAQRSQQQQQQQAAENVPALAGAAKDLGSTPADGSSLLAKIIGSSQARRTLNATAQPPVAVAG